MTTKQQYDQARKRLERAQNDSMRAMRDGNQEALDQASDDGVQAFAVIATYKDEQTKKGRR